MPTLKEKLEKLEMFPIPQEIISYIEKQSPNGKFGEYVEFPYLKWDVICNILDTLIGMDSWEWQIVSQGSIQSRHILVGRLTIHGDDRSISRDATGTSEAHTKVGDPISNSEAMAFRRAAAKFGLGRSFWSNSGVSPNAEENALEF